MSKLARIKHLWHSLCFGYRAFSVTYRNPGYGYVIAGVLTAAQLAALRAEGIANGR